jgi:AcrR family transcriptional regulator
MTKRPKSRGDATRQALILAAIEIFGRDGFHAASTREIARQAKANQAAIGYHFGGKDALYLAAIKHIAEQIGNRIGPITEEIRAKLGALANQPTDTAETKEKCLGLLVKLMNGMLRMLVDQQSSSWAKMILREQQSPTAAFDVFYDGLMGGALQISTTLVSKIRGLKPQAKEARLLAILVFGQVIVFRASREAVLRYMGWQDFREEEIESIQEHIQRNISAILTHGESQ